MKKIVVPLLKGGVAAGLIYYLVHSKKITAEPFIQLWGTPWLTFFVVAIIFISILINNYRWFLLLEGQKIQSSQRKTLSLTFIGLFFNLAMPGSVGGDVIKAYYIAQEQPGTKLRAATSVLMDRIVGLFALGLIALVAVLANAKTILASAALRPLAFFIFSLVTGFIVFFLLGFSGRVKDHALTVKFLNSIPGGKILDRIYEAIHSFKDGKKEFILGVILSLFVQSLNIICFFIIARTLNFENATLGALFFVVPIGLIATAIPLSPGGIGVGQAVFFTLFSWYGGVAPSLGPTLITIYQVVQGALSLIGALLYFMRKNQGHAPAMVSNP
jgi:uncharacterized protein (TIRG00374 family)